MRLVLGNYLRARVAGQMLALLAVLTGLMQLLELLDVTTDVLDRNLGVGGVIHYALLRLPSELTNGEGRRQDCRFRRRSQEGEAGEAAG